MAFDIRSRLEHNLLARLAVFTHLTGGLEVEQTFEGVRSKNAVDLAGVKAEGIETPLQVGDVVATHHRNPMVEETVSEAVAGSHQDPPGDGPTIPSASEPMGPLKRSDGAVCALPKLTVGVWCGLVTKRRKPALDITDRLSLIALPIEPHGHHRGIDLPLCPIG